ncbi:MAG: hypothetical protein ACI4V1_10395 [Eubacteriales bacterium]
MKKLTRLCCLLLSLLLLASCSEQTADSPSAEKNVPNADQTEPAETEDPDASLYTDLPTGNYDGRTFSILNPTHTEQDFVGDIDGDLISEAVYKRNLKVEEDLNVAIVPVSEDGLWDNRDSYMNKIKVSVMAADDSYQLISGYAAYITSIAAEGVLANWNNVSGVNFAKPWWNHDIVQEMDVAGSLYYITGDLSMTSLDYLFCLFFNKGLMQDFGLEEPYEVVKEGAWTFDTMTLYANAVCIDINGNGVMGAEDMYGYTSDKTNFVSAYQAAFDADITVKDDDGLPVLAIQEESFIDKFNTMYSFLLDSPSVYLAAAEGSYTDDLNREATKIFSEGRALLEAQLLGNAAALRNVEIEFGILPYPKYNEEQADYMTTAWDAYNLFCLPVTADLDFAGVVTECLAARSYQLVLPAFYDTALMSKYTRDTESADMISIIRESATYNFGQVNSIHCGSCGHIYRDLVSAENPNISSKIASSVNAMQKSLEKFIEDSYIYVKPMN